MVQEDRLLKPSLDNDMADCPFVLPLHNGISLDDDVEEKNETLKHLLDLKEIAKMK